jgi:hypothetical protein
MSDQQATACKKCFGSGVVAKATVSRSLKAELVMRRCGCIRLTKREFDDITAIITESFTREYNRRLPEVMS